MPNPHGGALKLHRRATFGEVSIAQPKPLSPANPPISETGTPVAISYLRLGGAPYLPNSIGRGGARNCATRESHALSAAHVGNLVAASAHADAIGLSFTRMVTIHWEAAGVPLSRMAEATGRYTGLMAKALARHGSRTAWLWVHENGDGKGGHCHLLAHVPAELVGVLTGSQRRWLRRISGKPYRMRVIRSDPIGGRLGLEVGNPNLHAINLATALAYVLKGASAQAASRFGLARLEPGGHIIGKRCGTSQNIGAKARKAKD
jgi:hypothetical protein